MSRHSSDQTSGKPGRNGREDDMVRRQNTPKPIQQSSERMERAATDPDNLPIGSPERKNTGRKIEP